MVLLEQEPWVPVLHRHLHRQKDMKYAYVILMTNLQRNGKAKIAKGFEKRVAKGKMEQATADAILNKIVTGTKRNLYRL